MQEEVDDNQETVLEKLNAHIFPINDIIFERAYFHLKAQKYVKSSEEYICPIHVLAKTCQFGSAKVENIWGRQVIRIIDKVCFGRTTVNSGRDTRWSSGDGWDSRSKSRR